MSAVLIAVLVLAGVGTGIVSALFGVGGGILIVPFLVLGLDKGQHLAQGTSLLVIIPTALIGVVAHNRQNYVSFRYAVFLATGGIGGAYLGSALALHLEGDSLRRLFGILMGVIAIRTLRRAWKRMRKERLSIEAHGAAPGDFLPPAD